MVMSHDGKSNLFLNIEILSVLYIVLFCYFRELKLNCSLFELIIMNSPCTDELFSLCRPIITMHAHGSQPGQSRIMPRLLHKRKWRQWLLAVNHCLAAQLVLVDLVRHLLARQLQLNKV